MSEISPCPQCQSTYVYEDGEILICPECGHEFSKNLKNNQENPQKIMVRDAYGVELKDGDSVTIIKDLKVKGSSNVVKVGTKIKNIRLVDADHNIDCKVPGIGAMGLKSEFVKKVTD